MFYSYNHFSFNYCNFLVFIIFTLFYFGRTRYSNMSHTSPIAFSSFCYSTIARRSNHLGIEISQGSCWRESRDLIRKGSYTVTHKLPNSRRTQWSCSKVPAYLPPSPQFLVHHLFRNSLVDSCIPWKRVQMFVYEDLSWWLTFGYLLYNKGFDNFYSWRHTHYANCRELWIINSTQCRTGRRKR